jgi:plastocyanin
VRRSLALVAAVLALSVLALPAHAGVAYHIAIPGFSFDPATKTVPVNTSMSFSWDNGTSFVHTATSNVDGLFDTGDIAPSASGIATLFGAGTYPYHCERHPDSMKGTLKARPKASKITFAVGGSSTITYGNQFTKGVTWDLQRRRNGGDFVTIRMNSSQWSMTFSPTRAGTYDFRGRTHVFGGATSAYSPIRTVTVTAG